MDFVNLIKITLSLVANFSIDLNKQSLNRKPDNIWWKIAKLLDPRSNSFKLPTKIYMAWKRNSNRYRTLVMEQSNAKKEIEQEMVYDEEASKVQFTSEEVLTMRKYISVEKKQGKKDGRRK